MKEQKGHPSFLVISGTGEHLKNGVGGRVRWCSGVGATDGGVNFMYSNGVAGCRESASSAEEVNLGCGAGVMHSSRLCSSLYTVLWVFGTCKWSAIDITSLKEDQGPWSKEEVQGSETSSLCEIPYG
jgi:hypothetical protein